MMPDENDNIEIGEDGSIHHIESSGVSSGVNAIPFHHVSRTTGRVSKAGMMWALGQRNLEFRRAEADKAGFDIVAHSEKDCPHCKRMNEED